MTLIFVAVIVIANLFAASESAFLRTKQAPQMSGFTAKKSLNSTQSTTGDRLFKFMKTQTSTDAEFKTAEASTVYHSGFAPFNTYPSSSECTATPTTEYIAIGVCFPYNSDDEYSTTSQSILIKKVTDNGSSYHAKLLQYTDSLCTQGQQAFGANIPITDACSVTDGVATSMGTITSKLPSKSDQLGAMQIFYASSSNCDDAVHPISAFFMAANTCNYLLVGDDIFPYILTSSESGGAGNSQGTFFNYQDYSVNNAGGCSGTTTYSSEYYPTCLPQNGIISTVIVTGADGASFFTPVPTETPTLSPALAGTPTLTPTSAPTVAPTISGTVNTGYLTTYTYATTDCTGPASYNTYNVGACVGFSDSASYLYSDYIVLTSTTYSITLSTFSDQLCTVSTASYTLTYSSANDGCQTATGTGNTAIVYTSALPITTGAGYFQSFFNTMSGCVNAAAPYYLTFTPAGVCLDNGDGGYNALNSCTASSVSMHTYPTSACSYAADASDVTYSSRPTSQCTTIIGTSTGIDMYITVQCSGGF